MLVPEKAVIDTLPQWFVPIALALLRLCCQTLSLQAIGNVTSSTEEEGVGFGKYLAQLLQYSLLESFFIFHDAPFCHCRLYLQIVCELFIFIL